MTPESVTWGIAWALLGLSAISWIRAGSQDGSRPSCEAPRVAVRGDGWAEIVCGAGPESELSPAEGAAGLLFGIPIDLNRAAVDDLVALPGIGRVRAEAIVAARGKTRFCRVSELTRVHGIGPRSVERLAGWARASCERATATP